MVVVDVVVVVVGLDVAVFIVSLVFVIIVGKRNLSLKFGQNCPMISDIMLLLLSLF